jgi:hypothetical protein
MDWTAYKIERDGEILVTEKYPWVFTPDEAFERATLVPQEEDLIIYWEQDTPFATRAVEFFVEHGWVPVVKRLIGEYGLPKGIEREWRIYGAVPNTAIVPPQKLFDVAEAGRHQVH